MTETVCLQNNAACVVIDATHGGRLASFAVHGQELLVTEARGELHWGCYPMTPWTGRLDRGRFTWQERRYQMRPTMEPHAIHGLGWQHAWQVDDRSEDALRLSTDFNGHWPFPCRAVQHIRLRNDALELSLELQALGDAFPGCIGWHPWFRRQLNTGDTLDYTFDAEAMYRRGEDYLPTGELIEPTEPPWDDCFTAVTAAPRIRWPGFIELELHSDADHWVVYSVPDHALCIEPMTGPPNSFNLRPATVSADEPLCANLTMRWHPECLH